ncbi:SDR family NAD(P)-dependent oxidoreductase [Roseovarius spongiae]|uniref:SDR family NAD(P)-dependent oxidoreductase n=1 Tax=Roseovarius spongiae TaxID=2320272 RepID=A0A3A8B3X5_9RHOB|nr:SDR family oxidoreductase [Roseovarius spongiae]RKF12624.1 SDR family NAD(P)-dependent oxidoreductase [Roseovarius spongiae]
MDDSVVVVTGASAGVGRALVRALGARGARVALLARGPVGLEAAAAEVRDAGGEALVLPTDVADADQVFAAADAVVERWGRIDLWINNAMTTVFSRAWQVTPEEFRRVTEVTYLGQVNGALAALRQMRQQGRGRILQVGSALAYRSVPLQSAYCGAKAAVRGFTDSLRTELEHENSAIRLTMVHLPAVNTPQFDWARTKMGAAPQPVPPIYAPADVARQILRAADTCPREMWIGAPAVESILGTLAVPAIMDRMMARDAWDSQMGEALETGARPDNLFTPVDRDMGADGRFGSRTRGDVTAWPAGAVRLGLAAAGVVGVLGAGWLVAQAAKRGRGA